MQTDLMLINRHFQDINPLECGWESCAPGHSFGPAVREYVLIHYVESGRGVFESGGARHLLHKGQIFCIHPYERTRYQADESAPWNYCWVGFQCARDLPSALCAPVADAPECEHIFTSLRGLAAMDQGRELYLCGKIYELLGTLSETAPAADRTAQYVLKAKNFIEARYSSEITVAQMAGYLGLDRSYFSTLFRQRTGKSPQQYLVDFRLQKAAELIALHGLRPGEAAASAGYRDLFNFSRMFKRRFGVSPGAYGKREEGAAEEGQTGEESAVRS